MEYNLEKIENRSYTTGVIKYEYYKILNWDKNIDHLKEYIKQLNENCMFNIDYYIYNFNSDEAIIEKVIDTLD